MAVTPSGQFISQRQVPSLATVETFMDGEAVALGARGLPEFPLAQPEGGDRMDVRVWDSKLGAHRMGAEADTWISRALGGDFQLVYMAASDHRSTNPEFAPDRRVSFADGYPVLIVSDVSVRELGRRVGREIPVERFRPNIVASAPEPHEEDRWRRFEIGDSAFEGVKQCLRCKVPTLDQETGTVDEAGEPLRTLATYRRTASGVWFGTNALPPVTGSIGVGDPIRIVEEAAVPAP